MADDIALQSQQFVEGVKQREMRALESQSEAWRALPGVVSAFQDSYVRSQQIRANEQQMQQGAEKHQMDQLQANAQLALDQQRMQQSEFELLLARELHNTDMLALQKREAKANVELAEARVNSELRKLEQDDMRQVNTLLGRDADDMDYIVEQFGLRPKVVNGKVVIGEASTQERSEAKKRRAAYMDLQKLRASGGLTALGPLGGGDPGGGDPTLGPIGQVQAEDPALAVDHAAEIDYPSMADAMTARERTLVAIGLPDMNPRIWDSLVDDHGRGWPSMSNRGKIRFLRDAIPVLREMFGNTSEDQREAALSDWLRAVARSPQSMDEVIRKYR